MAKILRFSEFAFTVIGFLVFSGAIILLVLSGGANQEDVGVSYNTSLLSLFRITIYGISGLLVIYRWKTSLQAIKHGVFFWGVIVLAVASVFWSSEPEATLRSSINLIGSSLFGFYLGTRYDLKQVLVILGWVFGISIILSFLFAILLPKYGLMGGVHSGTWRGVYMHKNGLGIRMVNSITVFLLLMFENRRHRENRRYRWIPYLGVLLSIVLLLFSQSTSALINTGFILVAFLVLHTIRWNYRLMVLALATLTVVGSILMIWLAGNAELIVGSFGKDLTLSGRTVLWSASWEMIQQQPWLGYGYDGFWHGMSGESAYIWLAAGWKMTHPHNGFIGALLDLGFVGLLLFLVSYVQNLSRSLLLLRLSHTVTAFYPILSLLVLFITNLTETSLPFMSELGCSLYVFLTLALAREIKHARFSKFWLESSRLNYPTNA